MNSADDDLALAFWILFYLVVSREILILISYKSSEVGSMEKFIYLIDLELNLLLLYTCFTIRAHTLLCVSDPP